MTPALREELVGLRTLAATLLTRIDEVLGPATGEDLRRGKTPAAIRVVIARHGAATPTVIAEELRAAGRDVTDEAVFTACSRMARTGALRRPRHGVYALPEGT